MIEGAEKRTDELRKLHFRKCIVALVGPPFTGKSTIGRELARQSNLTFLDVDKARWEIFPKTERLPQREEQFAMQSSYQRNHERAKEILEQDQPVILAATYSRPLYHEMLLWLSERMQAPLKVFLLDAPDEEIEQRVRERKEKGENSVVTSLDVYHQLKASYTPIIGVDVTHVHTNVSLQEGVEQVFQALTDLR